MFRVLVEEFQFDPQMKDTVCIDKAQAFYSQLTVYMCWELNLIHFLFSQRLLEGYVCICMHVYVHTCIYAHIQCVLYDIQLSA